MDPPAHAHYFGRGVEQLPIRGEKRRAASGPFAG